MTFVFNKAFLAYPAAGIVLATSAVGFAQERAWTEPTEPAEAAVAANPAPPAPESDQQGAQVRALETQVQTLKTEAAEREERLAALEKLTTAHEDDDERAFELEFHGYGEVRFAHHNFGADQTQEGGAPPDDRLVFDLTRFVLKLEGELHDYGVEFEVEVEFEHGGTGTALELEYEEFGEYESEVEKGGEVLVEELFVQKNFGESFSLRLGRFYTAFGLLPYFSWPTQYIASTRPESETAVVPGVWNEMGAQARYEHSAFRLTFQVLNGLDSTGFSSQNWVASGHQKRFELVRANNLAFVSRADILAIPGVLVGGSVYWCRDTNGNRPKTDLDGVTSPLVLASGYAAVDIAPFRARAALIWGHLDNADEITENNRRLSNNLGVLRSAVADQAIAGWGEVGVDVLHSTSLSGVHRLEPYVRFEQYDTMHRVSEETFDNPRFERTIITAGLAYELREAVFAKADWSRRSFGSADLRPERTVRLSAGFAF